jgi:hypothetical protein
MVLGGHVARSFDFESLVALKSYYIHLNVLLEDLIDEATDCANGMKQNNRGKQRAHPRVSARFF